MLTPVAQKHFAFSMRYTAINIGSSLGPLVAMMLGVLENNIVFYVAAFCVLLYFFLMQFTVTFTEDLTPNATDHNFLSSLQLFFKNKQLFYFILTAIICYIGFSQMATLFALISYHYTANIHIAAIMYALNGVSVVLLQMPIIHYSKKIDIHYSILIGIIFLTLGLAGVALATTHQWIYYISMIIFTLGEILTLSLVGIYVDQLATPETRYLYFGISGFALFGRIIGPPVATLLCHHVGLNTGLLMIAILMLFAIPLILLARVNANHE